MRLGWGHDDGAFFFSRPDAAQQECCEPGFTLLCMGLFSRFFVQALPCTAEGTVCRVRPHLEPAARVVMVPGAQRCTRLLREVAIHCEAQANVICLGSMRPYAIVSEG